MKWIISVLIALMLPGCGTEQRTTMTSTASYGSATLAGSATEEIPKSVPAQAPGTNISTAITAHERIGGSLLFAQRCAACHGANAQKQALGKSQMIAGWESERIESALKIYADGSHDDKMKAIMQAQVRPLNNEQIKSLAEYISKL